MNLVLILGNQLFDPALLELRGAGPSSTVVFMREDRELATYFKFHKHKIIFFFAAMRAYRDELEKSGYQVIYQQFAIDGETFEKSLEKELKARSIKKVFCFEIEDRFFEDRLMSAFKRLSFDLTVWESPMFLTSRDQFRNYLGSQRKPFMKTFYESQRRRLDILMEGREPVGGAWSFDVKNRCPLSRERATPKLPGVRNSTETRGVIELVNREFASHPGEGGDFWLPVDRKGARLWLRTFLDERLSEFGPYEDAIPQHSEFVFHSVLTPFLNCGLLTPREVIEAALSHSRRHDVPLASLEGFVRQVIGWREFVRGIYRNFDEKQQKCNFWNHGGKLSRAWYQGDTGVPPLDETIRRVVKRGYAHHIERLMVVGSLMVLLEVHPKEAHRWFMEMFIDSSDWVMGPNVYGMAIFSDGGIFATKPYICGSNYLRKMGGYPRGEWCDGVDGLYWGFIRKHEGYFLKNPRLAMMARSALKIPDSRWRVLSRAADELKGKLVETP